MLLRPYNGRLDAYDIPSKQVIKTLLDMPKTIQIKTWLIGSGLAFFCTSTFALNAPKALTSKIESLRKAMHIPGASVAVIEKAQIHWAQGFGYADLKNKKPVTPNTLFQAASITKTLTAAATLKLLNEKNVAPDEAVNHYLSRWQIPLNTYTKKVPVTFRMLLNHTGAISNPYPDGGYGPTSKLPSLTELLKGVKPATNPPLHVTHVPGMRFQYCNGCYTILQAAQEDISKQPYPELMQKMILNPANMHHSYFDNELYQQKKNQIALPYSPTLAPYPNAPTRSPVFATGYLWTTATDLANYNLTITQALKKSNQLLTKQQASQLIIPSVSPTHGLGFFIGDKKANEKVCGQYIFHSGANIGYLTLSIIGKDGQQGAVVLINTSPEWNAKDYPQFEFIKKTINYLGEYYHWS